MALWLVGVLVGLWLIPGEGAARHPARPLGEWSGGVALAQIQSVPLPTYTPAERTPRETLPREPRRVIERDQPQAAPEATTSPAPTP